MGEANPKVDGFFKHAGQWRDEFRTLRKIVLDCPLDEAMKWGQPCYSAQGKNIVLIHGFKEYCALLFFKGALLKDAEGILIQQTKNVQGPRQIRFTDAGQIAGMEPILKAYLREAMKVEAAGLKVQLKKDPGPIPEEFQRKLDERPALKTAFAALTPGRQRGYILHFSSAKQAKTREARVEKYAQRILEGKGLDDE